jgi:uncharacterized OB-fold protein
VTVDGDAEVAWPQPQPDPDTVGFWEAAAAGDLSICRCTECGTWMQPPLERCRRCAGPVEFAKVSGAGTLYSWITVNRQSVPGPQVPYQVGVAELDVAPGIRLSGVIVDADVSQLRVGMDVRVELRPVPGARFAAPAIIVNEPATGDG